MGQHNALYRKRRYRMPRQTNKHAATWKRSSCGLRTYVPNIAPFPASQLPHEGTETKLVRTVRLCRVVPFAMHMSHECTHANQFALPGSTVQQPHHPTHPSRAPANQAQSTHTPLPSPTTLPANTHMPPCWQPAFRHTPQPRRPRPLPQPPQPRAQPPAPAARAPWATAARARSRCGRGSRTPRPSPPAHAQPPPRDQRRSCQHPSPPAPPS